MQRLHHGGHGGVERGEAHVEDDEYEQQRDHTGIGKHVAFLRCVAVLQLLKTEPVRVRGMEVPVACLSGVHLDDMDHERLRAVQGEEDGAADGAGCGRHEELRDRVHGCREECGENRSEDEHDLVDGGFQCIGGVEQLVVAGAVEHIRPTGAHQRPEGELGQSHDDGQQEQQWDGHTDQSRECEAQHGDDLHGKYDPADPALAELVEQARVQPQWQARRRHS